MPRQPGDGKTQSASYLSGLSTKRSGLAWEAFLNSPRNKKRPAKDYFDMKEDTSVAPFSVFKTIDYYLFGASGFADDLLSQSDAHLHLVDLKAMFGI